LVDCLDSAARFHYSSETRVIISDIASLHTKKFLTLRVNILAYGSQKPYYFWRKQMNELHDVNRARPSCFAKC